MRSLLIIQICTFSVLHTLIALSHCANLVIFGTSLSDNGNLASLTPSARLLQTDGYFGNRHSNSYLWHEYIAHVFSMTTKNYAYSRATISNQITPINADAAQVPSISDQISAFLKETPVALTSDYYIQIELGGNDVLNHIVELLSGTLSASALGSRLAESVVDSVRSLVRAGFTNIVVWDVAPLEIIPEARKLGLSGIVREINEQVNAEISRSMEVFVGSNVRLLSSKKLFDVVLDPRVLDRLGIVDSSNECSSMLRTGRSSVCGDPDEYFFFDYIHPTGRVHYVWGVLAAMLGCSGGPSVVSVESAIAAIERFDIGHSSRSNNIIANDTRGCLDVDRSHRQSPATSSSSLANVCTC